MHDLYQQVAALDVATAIPNKSSDAIRGDLRTHVYAHADPPVDGPSHLEELKDQPIDGHPDATEYDTVTAGWEPEPNYRAFQDNVNESRLDDELDPLEAYLHGNPFAADGTPIIAYLPPAAARKYLNGGPLTTHGPLIAGVVTDVHAPVAADPPTAIQLTPLHADLTDDPTPVEFTDDASPDGRAGDAGWVNTRLLTAAWCLVPHTPDTALHLEPSDTAADITASRAAPDEADVHLHSPTPTQRTMTFTADIDGQALEVFDTLADTGSRPIPAVSHVEPDPWLSSEAPDDYWTVANDHLTRVLDAILEAGHTVTLPPEIEARYLPDTFIPDDTPPLPWAASRSQ